MHHSLLEYIKCPAEKISVNSFKGIGISTIKNLRQTRL